MIKRIRIAIDHGNRNIKTVHTVFTTGISESDISPGRGTDYLEYNGKFYVPSNRRIPYQRDKTVDQRFFLLTLLGIAKELELNPNIEKGDLIQVQMPIGLPPKHFAELYDKYESFFRGTGEMLQFNYKQKEYHGYDVPILKNISFTIEPGEKVFLMGSSGCGKSTLAKTIAGLVKYNKGEIIWGNDRNLNISDLSKQVLYLSQESEIFSGSIQENILMWEKDCNQLLFDEVIEAMGISQMMSSRSLSLDSYLSENGTNLSGGEKQRVALARAMMRNVPIYIFDEATCHLDFESENLIIDYIRKKLLEQTCIIISHNANLLNDNDIVLFIDSTGKLHKNKHSHLLENNLEYNQIIISRNPE